MAPPIQAADVFISHAWEDKEEIARPLAEELRRQGLTVWYDEYVLRLGDSLRQVIDKGLSSSRFGVVILSPSFFSKEWPQRELNGLLARETAHGTKVLLPVWHKITAEEVVKVSPLLADKLAVSTARGVDAVVRQILDVFEAEGNARVTKPASPRSAAAPSVHVAKVAPIGLPPAAVKTSAPAAKVHRRFTARLSPRIARTKLFSARQLLLLGALIFFGTLGVWEVQRRRHTAVPDKSQSPPSVASSSVSTPPNEGEQRSLESQFRTPQKLSVERLAEERRSALRGQLELLEDYERRQQVGVRLLPGIASSLPELLWLDQVSFVTESVSIKGRAFTTMAVANFIENLDHDHEAHFSEPKLVGAEEAQGGVFRFSLNMNLKPAPHSETATSPITEIERKRNALLHRVTPYGDAEAAVKQVRQIILRAGKAEKLISGTLASKSDLIDTLTMSGRVHDISSRELALLLERMGKLSCIVSLTKLTVTAGGREAVADLVLEIPVLKQGVEIPPGGTAKGGSTESIELVWPASKRGLFKSLPPSAVATGPCPEGFTGLLIDELELRGIWRTPKGLVAQVYAKSKAKTYLLKEGDQICDGDVVSISRAELVMKQIVNDPAAPKPFREVKLAIKAQ